MCSPVNGVTGREPGPGREWTPVIENEFLKGLGTRTRGELAPLLRRKTFEAGEILVEQETAVAWVAFPLSMQFASALHVDGTVMGETALVGAEGVTGLLPFLAHAPFAWRIEARGAGEALICPARVLRSAAETDVELRRRLTALSYFYQVQTAYMAACGTTHAIPQRVSRWLLEADDLGHGHAFHFTQDDIARLLGVQRTSVVDAFALIKKHGALKHSRGRIRLLDRAPIRAMACGCYD